MVRIFFGTLEFQMSLLFFVALSAYVLADISSFSLDLLYFLLALSIVSDTEQTGRNGLPAKLTAMSTRGEVAMIVVLLALQQNINQQPGFVAIILISLITRLIAPGLLRQLMKSTTS